MTFGSSYQEVRKNEGLRNRDSTVLNCTASYSYSWAVISCYEPEQSIMYMIFKSEV